MVSTRSTKAAKSSEQSLARARRKQQYSYPQRSSLRRALQNSLKDATPIVTPATTSPARPSARPSARPPARLSTNPRSFTLTNSNGIPTQRKGWFGIRKIVAEAAGADGRHKYLVDWEGVDPKSGVAWPSSWIDAKNVTRFAKREWEKRKAKKDAGTGADTAADATK